MQVHETSSIGYQSSITTQVAKGASQNISSSDNPPQAIKQTFDTLGALTPSPDSTPIEVTRIKIHFNLIERLKSLCFIIQKLANLVILLKMYLESIIKPKNTDIKIQEEVARPLIIPSAEPKRNSNPNLISEIEESVQFEFDNWFNLESTGDNFIRDRSFRLGKWIRPGKEDGYGIIYYHKGMKYKSIKIEEEGYCYCNRKFNTLSDLLNYAKLEYDIINHPYYTHTNLTLSDLKEDVELKENSFPDYYRLGWSNKDGPKFAALQGSTPDEKNYYIWVNSQLYAISLQNEGYHLLTNSQNFDSLNSLISFLSPQEGVKEMLRFHPLYDPKTEESGDVGKICIYGKRDGTFFIGCKVSHYQCIARQFTVNSKGQIETYEGLYYSFDELLKDFTENSQ